MPAFRKFAALAIAAVFLTPAATQADDSYIAPFSSVPTLLALCSGDAAPLKPAVCAQQGYDSLVTRLDDAIQAAAAKAPANVRPLLQRDQAFFYEMIVAAAEGLGESGNGQYGEAFVDMMRTRVGTLQEIASGFGRAGVVGKWVDAFGSVTVTAEGLGAYRLAIDGSALYGHEDERHWQCRASALLEPAAGGWLTGTLGGEQGVSAATPADARRRQPPPIKMRRQGETLRVVIGEQDVDDGAPVGCKNIEQITSSYFASGKTDANPTPDLPAAGFVAPTFDCTRPDTASEEEICADPDLSDNDRRLNRAWKALLPRLDEATRRALTEDQRNWVGAQANQYPEFLHPGWNKATYEMHYTTDARDKLDRLQRERIALLEGFDENRRGLAGVWLSYTAILKVTSTPDGGLQAQGWKWEQGDWKAGCDFDMAGKIVGGVFRSGEKRKNPDTLERDHVMLIVNRLDDVFAGKRHDEDTDEPKCKRSLQASSTARLFPARPSPDINDFGSSIR